MTAAATTRELLRLATAGSVDDGKSTLIGRLLLDTKLLLSDHLEAVSRDGDEPDLAAITDGLRAEREQGITIDVAYRFFATPRRSFILADTPGHERYTRNMFTGASTADLAIVLVDARRGVVDPDAPPRADLARCSAIRARRRVRQQDGPRRLGSQARFDDGRPSEVRGARPGASGSTDVAVVPISALHGDNVVERSERAPWYDGPPLLEHLGDGRRRRPTATLDRLRLPIQWVARPGRRARGARYAGQLAAGTLRAGRRGRRSLPVGRRRRRSPRSTRSTPRSTAAVPPLSVDGRARRRVDVGRGDVLVSPDDPPPRRARARRRRSAGWPRSRCSPGAATRSSTRRAPSARRCRRSTSASIPRRSRRRPSPTELGAQRHRPRHAAHELAVIVADPYAINRVTGAFILIDEHTNDTVGAGVDPRRRGRVEDDRQSRRDVTWHPSALDRDAPLGARSASAARRCWLTGLPASGKSTIAVALERRARRPRPGGLPARRRQHPPRPVRRPRLRARRPRRAHPPRRARSRG